MRRDWPKSNISSTSDKFNSQMMPSKGSTPVLPTGAPDPCNDQSRPARHGGFRGTAWPIATALRSGRLRPIGSRSDGSQSRPNTALCKPRSAGSLYHVRTHLCTLKCVLSCARSFIAVLSLCSLGFAHLCVCVCVLCML